MASAVDVEGLFRKFSVTEIKDIEKKVKADIERKKEDLRQMVGRRYRDIIEAADSINQMQVSSEKILSSIRRIEQSVERLHSAQQQLVVAGQRAKMHVRPSVQSTESLPKCIADLLELTHEALMFDQVLEAVWYFMTADYLYRAWKLDRAQQADAASKAFLENRFRSAGRLREKIMEAALKVISNLSNSTEILLDAVCAIAFLERANLEVTLEAFLKCRMNTLKGVIANTETSSREQICSALSILQKTVLQIHQLFVPSDSVSQTLERMRFLVSSRWQPPLLKEYAKRQSRQFSVVASDGIDYSKVFFMQSATDADTDRVCRLSKTWFDDALQLSAKHLDKLVQYFDTIESLTLMKESMVSSLEQFSESFEWNNSCQKLVGEPMSLWRILCSGPLESRVKELISSDVHSAFDALVHASTMEMKGGSMQAIGDRLSAGDWWREQRTDTIAVGTCSNLQLKARGLTKDIYGPVADLNSRIGQIDSAVSKFLSSRAGDTHRLFGFVDAAFNETLANSCVVATEKLISEIDKKAKHWEHLIVSDEKGKEEVILNLVLTAKLVQCLCDSATSVRQCIARRYGINVVSKVKEADGQQEKWFQLRSSLINSAGQLYRIWVQQLVNDARMIFEQELSKAVMNTDYWLDSAQEWEGIEIEEEAEDGQKVSSSVYVPSNCSPFVSQLLHNVAKQVVYIGAQSVQNDVLSTLSKTLRAAVANSFENVLGGIEMRQKRAVQLLFDLNVLTQMLHSATDAEENARLQRISDRLTSFVDPFDLDVLKPHLKRNAGKVLQKWQALYRNVYTGEACRWSNAANKGTMSTAESAQVLPLGQGQARFYLLPVVAEVEKQGVGSAKIHPQTVMADEGDKARHQAGRTQTLASTFYDKWSSTWFGGS